MKGLQTAQIIWAAMCALPLLFLVVVFAVKLPDEDPEPIMAIALSVVALGDAVASFLLPNRLLGQALRNMTIKTRLEVSAEETAFREAAGKREVIAEDRDEVLRRLLPKYFAPFILSMALSEAVVIFGFVLAFVGFAPPVYLPFFAVGWALMLSRCPSTTKLTRLAERRAGAPFPKAAHG